MTAYLLVAFGGAVGSVGRFWASGVAGRWLGVSFPWGTILINIAGSFVIGAFVTAGQRYVRLGDPNWRALVAVGLCGGFTTFSAFSLQTIELLREGRVAAARANVGLSVALCLLAAAAGVALFNLGDAA